MFTISVRISNFQLLASIPKRRPEEIFRRNTLYLSPNKGRLNYSLHSMLEKDFTLNDLPVPAQFPELIQHPQSINIEIIFSTEGGSDQGPPHSRPQ